MLQQRKTDDHGDNKHGHDADKKMMMRAGVTRLHGQSHTAHDGHRQEGHSRHPRGETRLRITLLAANHEFKLPGREDLPK